MGIKGLGKTTVLSLGNVSAVVDSFGAKCLQLTVNGDDLLFYDSEDIGHSGIPICFPSFGPLPNNEFIIDGKSYPMKQHGFARDCDFKIKEESGHSLTYVLTESEETKSRFPFDFEFLVTYKLLENGLSIKFQMTNKSQSDLPISPGVHPYFAVDNPNDILVTTRADSAYNNLNAYELENLHDSDYLKVINETDIKTLKVEKNPDHHLTGHDLEQTEIFRGEQSKITMEADLQTFKMMAIWRKAENSPFICVEPSNIQNGLNINPIYIPPSGTLKTGMSITA